MKDMWPNWGLNPQSPEYQSNGTSSWPSKHADKLNWPKYDILSAYLTLKTGSRSSKPNQFLPVSQWCSNGSLVRIHQLVLQIVRQALIFNNLSHVMTLKIMSRSPNSSQVFYLSQLNNTPSLVWIKRQRECRETVFAKFWHSYVPCDLEKEVKVI